MVNCFSFDVICIYYIYIFRYICRYIQIYLCYIKWYIYIYYINWMLFKMYIYLQNFVFQPCFDQKETRTQELPLNPKNQVLSKTACFETPKKARTSKKQSQEKTSIAHHTWTRPTGGEWKPTFTCKIGWRNNLIIIFDSQNLRHPQKHTETSKNPVNGGDKVPQLA